MATIDITYFNLLLGFVLLLIPLFILWYYRTGLVRTTVVAVARMTAQLLFIGFYLKYLFEWNNPYINIAWVLGMILIAGQAALSRTKLPWRLLLLPVSVAFLTAITLVGGYFLGVVVELNPIFDARYFIPISGSLLGNMLSANVIALNAYFSGLQRERQLYYFLLGNGATRHEAQIPFIRTALLKSFNPTIANMAVMGLVALPGTMIGQILGGSSPDVSIKYQIMIMLINFSASILSVVISIKLCARQSFDAYGCLKAI
ncbi:MAG: ABC transporter permease [Tannerellaceae bacterium]